MPRIWYFQDKKRKYYPDIYIEKENLIIEVKSLWTMNKYFEKNMMKQKACWDAGYNFIFMIFDKEGNIIHLI
jgi:hypothetical protein